MIREPAVAGRFYHDNPEMLRREIEEKFLNSKLGPGALPAKPSGRRLILGAVSPHAGYMFSGYTAAHTYKAIYEDGKPDVFVIIGPNHTGFGPPVSLFSGEAWKTPLGLATVNLEFARYIAERGGAVFDRSAHRYEHSVEVQIPFLQYLYGDDFTFVPIVMMDQSPEAASALAESIIYASEETGFDVLVIASSDFSHYVPDDYARTHDRLAIDELLDLDADGFYQAVAKYDISACGPGAIATSLIFSKRMGASSAELLSYTTSGDVIPSSEVVGYASLVFKR